MNTDKANKNKRLYVLLFYLFYSFSVLFSYPCSPAARWSITAELQICRIRG